MVERRFLEGHAHSITPIAGPELGKLQWSARDKRERPHLPPGPTREAENKRRHQQQYVGQQQHRDPQSKKQASVKLSRLLPEHLGKALSALMALLSVEH